MKQTLWRRIAIGVLAFAFPGAALADLSRTVTLQANTALDLETGDTSVVGAKVSASGGTPDILWNGSTITPQGGARAANSGEHRRRSLAHRDCHNDSALNKGNYDSATHRFLSTGIASHPCLSLFRTTNS